MLAPHPTHVEKNTSCKCSDIHVLNILLYRLIRLIIILLLNTYMYNTIHEVEKKYSKISKLNPISQKLDINM